MSLGAIPVLSEVMVATRGATDAFSGVQRHVNNTVCVTNIGSSLYVLIITVLYSFVIFLMCLVKKSGCEEHSVGYWLWSGFWPWIWSWYVSNFQVTS